MKKSLIVNWIPALFAGVGPGQTPVVPQNGAMPDGNGLGAAILGINPFQEAVYNAATNTAAVTAAANQISGAAQCFLNMTGALAAAANLQLPTVAQLLAGLPTVVQQNPVGISWQLRIINSSTGAFAWTVTTNTGWTLGGSMGVAQNTFRDFIITITSLTTASIQSVGTGTQS